MANERKRVFAFVIYEDSAAHDWIVKLQDLCVQGYFVYHANDKNEDGALKKPHYHVMLFFAGKKSQTQVDDIVQKVGAANAVYIEVVNPVGYARYLCHLDNPDKFQYALTDVHVLGGFTSYLDYIGGAADFEKILCEIEDFLEGENDMGLHFYSFHAFARWCRLNNPVWHNIISTRCTLYIDRYLKSKYWESKHNDTSFPVEGVDYDREVL